MQKSGADGNDNAEQDISPAHWWTKPRPETTRLAQLAYGVAGGLLDPLEREVALPLDATFDRRMPDDDDCFIPLLEATIAAASAMASEESERAFEGLLSSIDWSESQPAADAPTSDPSPMISQSAPVSSLDGMVLRLGSKSVAVR